MIAEAIDKILMLSPVEVQQIGALAYAARPLHLVVEPDLSGLSVTTLTGLADWIRARPDALDPAQWVLHVEHPQSVRLIRRSTDMYGRRTCLAQAKPQDAATFAFGRWMEQEEFIIGLQSQFVATPDLEEVLRLVSNLEVSAVTMSDDDGISQRTTVKQGVTLKEVVRVRRVVRLSPYRTFAQVTQPASAFVFRLKSRESAVPLCGLFEADGGAWKIEAVETIRQWLEAAALGMPVVA